MFPSRRLNHVGQAWLNPSGPLLGTTSAAQATATGARLLILFGSDEHEATVERATQALRAAEHSSALVTRENLLCSSSTVARCERFEVRNRLVSPEPGEPVTHPDPAAQSSCPGQRGFRGTRALPAGSNAYESGETARSRVDRRGTLPVLPISSPDSARRMHELIGELTLCRSPHRARLPMPSSHRAPAPHHRGIR
jgi:alkylated DNA repair dioxygenase AlkB